MKFKGIKICDVLLTTKKTVCSYTDIESESIENILHKWYLDKEPKHITEDKIILVVEVITNSINNNKKIKCLVDRDIVFVYEREFKKLKVVCRI